jgi:hypothetical protein
MPLRQSLDVPGFLLRRARFSCTTGSASIAVASPPRRPLSSTTVKPASGEAVDREFFIQLAAVIAAVATILGLFLLGALALL